MLKKKSRMQIYIFVYKQFEYGDVIDWWWSKKNKKKIKKPRQRMEK